jgi:subtilisin
MRYIVMPLVGWRSERMLDFDAQRPLREIARRDRAAAAATKRRPLAPGDTLAGARYALAASVTADGPKVLDMTPEAARRLRAASPSTLVEPNTMVYAAVRPAVRIARAEGWRPGPDARRLTVRVVDEAGDAVAGARVLAFADPHHDVGASRSTRAKGLASFALPRSLDRIARLLVLPPSGYLGAAKVRVAAHGEIEVELRRVDPATFTDAAHRWRAGLDPDAGQGVRVGVVDTGVDIAHPDLAHVTARSVYSNPETPGPPHPHGTQVAGIIGARGARFRGLAPAAELYSYRIAAPGARKSDAFHLGEGISRAARDNDLHLINISMVQSQASQFLAKAAAEAYQQGAVCIAAAGNDSRDRIGHPAAAKRVLAVTAYGDQTVLSADAVELGDLSPVRSATEPHLARAAFSNWGPETDFIAPGVALISCHGADGYAVDSGTSFAAPVVTGLAAAMLSKHYPAILAMPKGPRRAAAITQALLDRGRDLGFAFETQGIGIVDV